MSSDVWFDHRLEQHERMLQERERERREGARSAGLMSRQPTRTDIRYGVPFNSERERRNRSASEMGVERGKGAGLGVGVGVGMRVGMGVGIGVGMGGEIWIRRER